MRHSAVSHIALLSAGALLAAGLAGCASPSAGGEATPTGKTRIAFLRSVPEGPFSISELDGINSVVTPKGYSVDVFAANYDPGAQKSQCDTVISSGDYAGIVIVPVDTMAAASCVTAAAGAGISVVALEQPIGPDITATGIQVDGLDAQVILNQPAYVAQWADAAVAACGDRNPCKIGLVRGDPQYPDDALQRARWDAEVAAHPQLTIVAEAVGGYSDPNLGISATQNILQTAPDVDLLAVSDDETAAGVVSELARAGKAADVAVIGFGGPATAIDRIKAGTQYGSIVLTPKSAAAAAAELLLTAIAGDTIAQPSVDWTQISPLGGGNVLVTSANVAQFTPEY